MRIRASFFSNMVATFLVAGCSNVPLQDDVTHLSTRDIIQKVRCEARDAVMDYLRERGLAGAQAQYLQMKYELALIEEELADYSTVKQLIDRDYKPILALVKSNSDNQRQLRSHLIGLLEEEKRVLDELLDPKNSISEDVLEQRLRKIQTKRLVTNAALDAAKAEAPSLTQEKATALRKVNEQIAKLRLPITADRYSELAEEKDGFDSLLKHAVARSPRARELEKFNGTTLSMRFDFFVTENNNASSKGTITWPVSLGSIKLSYGIGDEKKRQARRVVKVTDAFVELSDSRKISCWDTEIELPGRAKMYPMSGSVGVADFINQYLRLTAMTAVASADKDTYTDTLTFTTKVFGGLTPSVELKPSHPNLVQASADLNADRTDVHEVAVQLKPKDDPKAAAKPTEISIKSVPEVQIEVDEDLDGPLIRVR